MHNVIQLFKNTENIKIPVMNICFLFQHRTVFIAFILATAFRVLFVFLTSIEKPFILIRDKIFLKTTLGWYYIREMNNVFLIWIDLLLLLLLPFKVRNEAWKSFLRALCNDQDLQKALSLWSLETAGHFDHIRNTSFWTTETKKKRKKKKKK